MPPETETGKYSTRRNTYVTVMNLPNPLFRGVRVHTIEGGGKQMCLLRPNVFSSHTACQETVWSIDIRENSLHGNTLFHIKSTLVETMSWYLQQA